jgi:hypothetical protein
MNKLYHSLKDKNLDAALVDYNYVENLGQLRDFATDVLYNFEGDPNELLLITEGYNTFTRLIDLIHSATPAAAYDKIHYHQRITEHRLNKIPTLDLANFFTILLNLYSNAINKGGLDFKVHIVSLSDDQLKITISNKGEMEEPIREFFTNDDLEPIGDGQGILFIKAALKALTNVRRTCTVADGWTTINLIIYEQQTNSDN